LQVGFLPPHAVQGAQVDQDLDEGILVDDGPAVALPGALDAKFLGLGIDALGGGALVVDGPGSYWACQTLLRFFVTSS
jgi:hypothetical protein